MFTKIPPASAGGIPESQNLCRNFSWTALRYAFCDPDSFYRRGSDSGVTFAKGLLLWRTPMDRSKTYVQAWYAKIA